MALNAVEQRKAPLIGTPVQGYAVYRRDLSGSLAWSVVGARFIVVTLTRDLRPVNGSAWVMADSTLYVFQPVASRREADCRAVLARVFAGAQIEHARPRGWPPIRVLAERAHAEDAALTFRTHQSLGRLRARSGRADETRARHRQHESVQNVVPRLRNMSRRAAACSV
jgi:hypothetical protein